MSTVVSSSSDRVDNTGCRLRKIDSGTSLHTTRTVSPHINNNSSNNAAQTQISNSSSPNRQCCFHWCCCCRPCSCLAVKAVQEETKQAKDQSTENLLNTAENPTLTLDEIRAWGTNFDRLMKSTAGRNVFKEFLQGEYSDENILFWQACEDLKKETNATVIEERARYIYEDFISILSPKEVSLDSKVRDLVNRNMNSPSVHTFDEAQTQIYTLMQRDSYPRFLNSDIYKNLLQPPGSNDDVESTRSSVKGSGKESSSRASSVRKKRDE